MFVHNRFFHKATMLDKKETRLEKNSKKPYLCGSWSKAERCGLAAMALAVVLGAIDLRLATVPLALLLILCAAAPFLPRAGFFFPVVHRGSTGQPMVALTFDDGPDPGTTPQLLDLLAAYRVPAAFFVTGVRAARYPDLMRAIVAHGHEVGNHSFHHNHFQIFWRPGLLAHEISATQLALKPFGITPLAFRPPVGITTPAMGNVLDSQRLYALNFSCRAFDRGNRRIKRLASIILGRIRPDDIVLLHDAMPDRHARVDWWLAEVEKILQGLSEHELTAVPLSHLIGRPVMQSLRADVYRKLRR